MTTNIPKSQSTSVEYFPIDLTSCFNTQAKLGGTGSTTPISVLYTTGTTGSGSNNKEHLDGVALDVTFGRADPNAQVFLPESGCITAYPNFDDGYNNPDCAVMKWDSVESRVVILIFPIDYFHMCGGTTNDDDNDCLPNAVGVVRGNRLRHPVAR